MNLDPVLEYQVAFQRDHDLLGGIAQAIVWILTSLSESDRAYIIGEVLEQVKVRPDRHLIAPEVLEILTPEEEARLRAYWAEKEALKESLHGLG